MWLMQMWRKKKKKSSQKTMKNILRNYLLFFLNQIINVCLAVQAHFDSIKKEKQ